MNWSINLIGTKADVSACVKSQIIDNGNAPEIGSAIISEINAIPDPIADPYKWGATHVKVIGSGHHGSGFTMLTVEPLSFCQPPITSQTNQ